MSKGMCVSKGDAVQFFSSDPMIVFWPSLIRIELFKFLDKLDL